MKNWQASCHHAGSAVCYEHKPYNTIYCGPRQLHKFGGSSLADAEGYRRVTNIISEYSEPGDLLVVFAAGDTTDQLIS